MEITNVTPNEVRRTLWHAVAALCVLIVVFRLPAIISAIAQVMG